MAIENTPNIHNPAAVVKTTSRGANNGSGDSKSVSRDEGAVKVEISPQVSNVSRAKAASGDNRLSAQSLAAIASGKPAPSIARIEIPAELAEVANEISTAQQSQITDSDAVESPVNLEALANAAAAFAATESLTPEQPAIPSNVEALLTGSNTGSQGGDTAQAAPVSQDTATTALGNTADITV